MALTKVTGGVRALTTGEVDAAALAADAVTTVKVLDSAITTAKLADNSVTGAKIAVGSDAQGDILYYDGTDYIRLAKGSENDVLSVVSNVPSWGAPTGMVPLRRLQGTLATYDFDFTDLDNATYGVYPSFQLRGWVRPDVDDRELYCRTSADGSAYDAGASDYKYALYGLINGSLAGISSSGDSKIRLLGSASSGQAMGNDAHARTQICLDIEGPEQAARYGTMNIKVGGIEAASNFAHYRTGMAMRANAAVMRGVQLLFETGDIAAGDVTLYGITGA